MKEKRALVISGGGSKGAFAGGFAEHVIEDLKVKYDLFVGTSTGGLLLPHLALGQIDKIKYVYNTATQKSIYNISPFSVKKLSDGKIKSSIRHFNLIRMFLGRKKTFGEHRNLRMMLKNVLTIEDFNAAKKVDGQVIITVSNLTKGTTEYKHLRDCEYEDFLDWMWASTSFVPFMSLVSKNGFEYADGGFGDYLPIAEAANLGANVIDAIILIPRVKKTDKTISKNPFELFFSTMDFMHQQIAKKDLMIGYLESIYNKDVKVNFYFTPRLLTKFSFYFDPVRMSKWWDEGYEYAKENFKV